MCAKLAVTHAVAVVAEVREALGYFLPVVGVGVDGSQQGVETALVELVAASLGPLLDPRPVPRIERHGQIPHPGLGMEQLLTNDMRWATSSG